MTITIKLKTDNAAFQEPDRDTAIGEILRDIARDWPWTLKTQPLRDYNGNTVGTVTVTGK